MPLLPSAPRKEAPGSIAALIDFLAIVAAGAALDIYGPGRLSAVHPDLMFWAAIFAAVTVLPAVAFAMIRIGSQAIARRLKR